MLSPRPLLVEYLGERVVPHAGPGEGRSGVAGAFFTLHLLGCVTALAASRSRTAMLHRKEQPTLFELNACDELDSCPGLVTRHSPLPLSSSGLVTRHSSLFFGLLL